MDVQQSYTLEEVAKHNSREDCWMVIDGKVYDCTNFIDEHPGGGDYILDNAGIDATMEFLDVGHSDKAVALLKDFYIGECSNPKYVNKLNSTGAPTQSTTTATIQEKPKQPTTSTNNNNNDNNTNKQSSTNYITPLIILGAVIVIVSAVFAYPKLRK